MGNIEETTMTTTITFKPDPKAFAKKYAEFLKDQAFYKKYSEE
jgi:hypothetical protein